MTTKVTVELAAHEHSSVKVTTVHAKTKDPFGYSPVIKPGNKMEFYVHLTQSLLIEEVKDDHPTETKE